MVERLVDELDIAIVSELQADARQSTKAIAAKVGLAPSSTSARIRELERRGIIMGYGARLHAVALGRSLHALVFVRLQPKSDDLILRFKDHIWELTETIGVQVISGDEDMVVHLATNSPVRLRDIVMQEIVTFEGVASERTVLLFEHHRKEVIDPLSDDPD